MRLVAATALILIAELIGGGTLRAEEGDAGVPFDHVVTVRFAGEPEYPVTVLIRRAFLGPIAQSFLVPDAAPLSIHCRLKPGKYQIESVLTASSSRYWDDPIHAEGRNYAAAQFAIRDGGEVNHLFGLPQELFHQFKIEVIGPKNDFVAGKKSPLLSWKPVEGASHYRVYWTESNKPEKRSLRDGSLETETPFVEINLELTPGARYEWRVDAFSAENRPIGFWGPSFFFADEAARQTFQGAPDRLDRGGYLGVSIGETDQPVPGIRIIEVSNGAPASLAGLQNGDVITKFAGIPLADMSVAAFRTLARSQAPSSQVEVEYVRGVANPKSIPAAVIMGTWPDAAR